MVIVLCCTGRQVRGVWLECGAVLAGKSVVRVLCCIDRQVCS